MVSDCYEPRVGGIERHVAALARHLARAGHRVFVVTATAESHGAPSLPATSGSPAPSSSRDGANPPSDSVSDPAADQVSDLHSHVVQIRRLGRGFAGLPVTPSGYRLLSAELAEIRPDVVHIHAGLVSPFANQAIQIALAAHIPLVITWHSVLAGVMTRVLPALGPLGRTQTMPLWYPRQLRSGQGAVLTAVSARAAFAAQRCFGTPIPVKVLINAVDPGDWDIERPVIRAGGALRVVSAMRLAPRKRVADIVRLSHTLTPRDATCGVDWVVCGTGPFRHLASAVTRTRVVRFVGLKNRDALKQLYRQADVFVAPSPDESFGLAALEARLAGLPIIVRTGAPVADLFDNIPQTELDSASKNALDSVALSELGAGLQNAVISVDSHAKLGQILAHFAQNPSGPQLAAFRDAARTLPPIPGWKDSVAEHMRLYAQAIALVTASGA